MSAAAAAAAVECVVLYTMDLEWLTKGESVLPGIPSSLSPVLLHYASSSPQPPPTLLPAFCLPTPQHKAIHQYTRTADTIISLHSFLLNIHNGTQLYGAAIVKLNHINISSCDNKEEDEKFVAEENHSALYYPMALCLLSRYPLYSTFNKRLAAFATVHPDIFSGSLERQKELVQRLFVALKNIHYPQLEFLKTNPEIQHRDIPAEINYELLFNILHYKTIIAIFTSLLCESSVVVLSSKVSILVPVMESLKSLLYPLQWIFTFVPVLPSGFEDILDTPQPIFVGMQTDSFKADYPALREIIIVDLDANSIKFPFKYKATLLPTRISAKLNQGLNSLIIDDKKEDCIRYSVKNMDKVRQEFLSAMAYLLEGYKKFVIAYGTTMEQSRQRSFKNLFDQEKFLEQSPPFYVAFQQILVRTQSFQQFIEERHAAVIDKKETEDQFEIAVARRKRKRSQILKKFTQLEKRGPLWIKSSSIWTKWKKQEIVLEGKCIYRIEPASSLSCSSVNLGCSSGISRKLLCRLDSDLKVRIINLGQERSSPIPCTPYGFQILNSTQSKRKINMTFCAESEQDLNHWVDVMFSKITTNIRKPVK